MKKLYRENRRYALHYIESYYNCLHHNVGGNVYELGGEPADSPAEPETTVGKEIQATCKCA